MGARGSVFGSKAERRLFLSLQSRWGDRFPIYPSLPFCQVLDVADYNLTPDELAFLFQSSIDYTLCDPHGAPLLSIEFDGVANGFSSRGRYVPGEGSRHLSRARTFDLKLRIAQQAKYPFVVVSYEEGATLRNTTSLTIVDGVVGQVLARRDFNPQIEDRFYAVRESVADLSSEAEHDYVQNLVLDVEAECEMAWDPLEQVATDAFGELWRHGIGGRYSIEFLDEPGVPTEPIDARIEALLRARRVGMRITIDTPKGPASGEAWIRNIDGSFFSPLTIAENVAGLTAAHRALKMNGYPIRAFAPERDRHARQG